MGFDFNANDVFEMGIQVELNGEAFYRAASKATDDPKLRGALADLARQESIHQSRFRQLREKLTEEDRAGMTFDPDSENAAYLEAAASTHVFAGDLDPEAHFAQARSAQEILQMALRFEKDSIVFFLGMKDFVPPKSGQETIDWLVKEEMSHIQNIRQMMKQY